MNNIKKVIATVSAVAVAGIGVYGFLLKINKIKVPNGSTLMLNSPVSTAVIGSTLILSGVLNDNNNNPIDNQLISLHPFSLTQNTNKEGIFSFAVTINKIGIYNIYASTADIKSRIKVVDISPHIENTKHNINKNNLTEKQKTAIANTTHSNKLVMSGASQSTIDKQLTIALTAQGYINAVNGYKGAGTYFIPSKGFSQKYIKNLVDFKLALKKYVAPVVTNKYTITNNQSLIYFQNTKRYDLLSNRINKYNMAGGFKGPGLYYLTKNDLNSNQIGSGIIGSRGYVTYHYFNKGVSLENYIRGNNLGRNKRFIHNTSVINSSTKLTNTRSTYYKPLQVGYKGPGYYKASHANPGGWSIFGGCTFGYMNVKI